MFSRWLEPSEEATDPWPGRLQEWWGRTQALLGDRPLERLLDLRPYLRHGRRYLAFQRDLLAYRRVLAVLLARRHGVFDALASPIDSTSSRERRRG